MRILATILARAGSKGLHRKCLATLLGRPLIDYTFDHALESRRLDRVVLTTDCPEAADLAKARGIATINRPSTLATDDAPVDATVRHAVTTIESRLETTFDAVVILYANIPIRPPGAIDKCLQRLIESGADSVRTVAPIAKHHPDWLHRLEGDRLIPFRPNSIHRRQDLKPLYYHDGAVIAVTRASLFATPDVPGDPHAFFGADRRAIVCRPHDAVDVDNAIDLLKAEAILRRPQIATRRNGVTIGEKHIGPESDVFIIAEAGVNHQGDVNKALEMVAVAADAGADAVKFQIFTARELVTDAAPKAPYQSKSTGRGGQRSMLESLELTDADFEAVAEKCHKRGILFMATPFTPSDTARLAKLAPPCVKIASPDIVDHQLLESAFALNVPVILSVGAANTAEIEAALALADQHDARHRTILLHCVSRYPTPLDDANLAAIATLARQFNLPTGFSDHTVEAATGALAVAAGACVLEKHFTLDPAAEGPDQAISLSLRELTEYIRLARQARRASGSGTVHCAPEERDVRTIARKSIVAACAIAPGQTVTTHMLTLKRAGAGLAPDQWDWVSGRRATVAIESGAPLEPDMLA